MQGGKLYLPIGLEIASLTLAFLRRDMRICEDAPKMRLLRKRCFFGVTTSHILISLLRKAIVRDAISGRLASRACHPALK